MGDSKNNLVNLERSDCATGAENKSTLGGDLLVSRSSNEAFNQNSSSKDLAFLPSGKELLEQLAAQPQPMHCDAPTQEKRGNVDVTIDEHGEMILVKDDRGHTFTKQSDGGWTDHQTGTEAWGDDKVQNVKVACNGDISFDYVNGADFSHENLVHDGSYNYVNKLGKFAYDSQMHLVEAPAGDGTTRKFHYTGNQIDQIDGKLGHWDRVVKDGQPSWINTGKNLAWDGDMKVDIDASFKYKSNDEKTAWSFGVTGQDKRISAEDYDKQL